MSEEVYKYNKDQQMNHCQNRFYIEFGMADKEQEMD